MKKKITITVTLKGWPMKYINNNNKKNIQVPQGSTVKDVIESTSLPNDWIGYIIEINGINTSKDHQIKDGDDIIIYPMVVGG